jgi:hypothetical protein
VHVGLEEAMKLLTWVVIGGLIAVGVFLYLGKDDLRRMREMRQM